MIALSPPLRQRTPGVVCFGEILLRLAAPGQELLLQSPQLMTCFGGAEANVAVSLAMLGHHAKMATIVPDTALGAAALSEFRRHGVDVSHVVTRPGRLGLYFLVPGAERRAAHVIYDRAHTCLADAAPDLLDWTEILTPGDWLHVSGITPALSVNATAATLRAINSAAERGCRISVDCNYRGSLWAARQTDPAPILDALCAGADLLFANSRDLELIVGRPIAPVNGPRGPALAAAMAFERYPRLTHFAGTERRVSSADCHDLSAYLFSRDSAWETQTKRISPVVDRIGGGDAFAAGVLHGLLGQQEAQALLDFALAAACIKHSLPGDFSLATTEMIRAYLADGLDVRR